MKFLAVDIGKGTQDIVYRLPGKVEENWPKLILPSPTEKLSIEVSKFSKDLNVCGYTMGGGPVKRALLEHIKKGFKVRITKEAAKTIRDDLNEVKRMGFEVVDCLETCDLFLTDLDLELYRTFLGFMGESLENTVVGVACQDHGFVKGQSDRITRFEYFKKILREERDPRKLVIVEETGFFSRFDSILRQLQLEGVKGFVMDSKIAAVAGMVEYARKEGVDSFIVLDIGNGHTLGASVKGGRIAGLFEHHTKMLNREKLRKLVERLASAEILFEEVFNDGGHGALAFEPVKPEKIYVVGPNRELFRGYGEFAYPLGDAMLYGCAGLVSAAELLL